METALRGVGGPGAGLQDRGPLMGSASEVLVTGAAELHLCCCTE